MKFKFLLPLIIPLLLAKPNVCLANATKTYNGNLIEFNSQVHPSPLILECDDQVISDQTLIEYHYTRSAPCSGLACALQGVADKIAGDNTENIHELEQQGYARTNITREGKDFAQFFIPFSYQHKARFKITPSIELDPGDEAYGFQKHITDKKRQRKTFFTPPDAITSISSDKNNELRKGLTVWGKSAMEGAKVIVQLLKGHEMFSHSELSSFDTQSTGTIRRSNSFQYCGKSISVTYTLNWKKLSSISTELTEEW